MIKNYYSRNDLANIPPERWSTYVSASEEIKEERKKNPPFTDDEIKQLRALKCFTEIGGSYYSSRRLLSDTPEDFDRIYEYVQKNPKFLGNKRK